MVNSADDWLDAFLTHLRQERRMADHTIVAYQRDLQRCQKMRVKAGIDRWQAVTSHHIRQWTVELNRADLSARSIQRLLSSLRGFFRYLMREGGVVQNPAEQIQGPKTAKRLPSTLDIDQVTRLLDGTQQDSFLGARDRAIMELFYSSGLRLAELARLDCRDIDMADHLAYVTGKGNKDRVVPIGRQAIAAIQLWLGWRQQKGGITQMALFITQQGKRLGERAIQKRLKLLGQKQGISDKVHPHRLRHAFASHMLESSGDLRAVQELLGHADIATTQIYTHVDFQHLARVYDAAHPRAKK